MRVRVRVRVTVTVTVMVTVTADRVKKRSYAWRKRRFGGLGRWRGDHHTNNKLFLLHVPHVILKATTAAPVDYRHGNAV